MHPLFARPIRLLLLIAGAALFGVPLAWVLRVLTPRPWGAALAFAVPMQVFLAFVVMSAWWVCRRNPMQGSARGQGGHRPADRRRAGECDLGGHRRAVGDAGRGQAGVQRTVACGHSSGTWESCSPPASRSTCSAPSRTTCIWRSRPRATPSAAALETQVTAREAELRALRAQTQSALPVQQPELDQRAGRQPTPRARAACARGSATSCATR